MPVKKGPTDKSDGFHLEAVDGLTTEMDPHLQEVVLAARAGQRPDPAVCREMSDGHVVVDVIAKLKHPDKPVPGLNVVRTVGQIATGTVDINKIEEVRRHANVQSLKSSTRVFRTLEYSVPEIRATQAELRTVSPSGPIDGAGVIIGVVDFGCDFAHGNFRKADGSTRLLFLWDQNGTESSASPAGFGYGREFDAGQIDAALRAQTPYAALRYTPGRSAHGTHVMDIAAGNGASTGHPGVAPGADLIFVELAGNDTTDDESFGSSRQLLEAVDYIFNKAAELNRAVVVNLSLGTHGGPHDGSTLVEQGFDVLLERPGRAIVISAGNSAMHRSHASGVIESGQGRTLSWEIDTGDPTGNEIEVWYPGNAELKVALITPSGQRLGPVKLGDTMNIRQGSERVGRIIHRRSDPNNGDHHVDILLNPGMPGGTWGVELAAPGGAVSFHAWVERDHPAAQSRLDSQDDDRSVTIGSISCGARTIVVGSYTALVDQHDISPFSSYGPTRDGKRKPEVSAPGQDIVAARSMSQGTTRMSGTSMAAPHVAGTVALLMQASSAPLSADAIRQAIMTTARGNPSAGDGWNDRFGNGRVEALGAVQTVVPPVQTRIPSRAVTALRSIPRADIPVAPVLGPMDGLVTSLAENAARIGARVRVEIEVSPFVSESLGSAVNPIPAQRS